MGNALHFAFVDEAGNTALSRQNHILVAAALCMGNPRPIARIIRKTQKKYGSSLASGELKAKKAHALLVEHLLGNLAREEIAIFSVIVDRRNIQQPPKDAEEIYRWAMARLVEKMVEKYPSLEIVLDRRYTTERLRDELERKIRERISPLPQHYVMITQKDSALVKELQAVDFIAWAFFQKYERGNDRFYDLIAERIVEEEYVTRQAWERAWK